MLQVVVLMTVVTVISGEWLIFLTIIEAIVGLWGSANGNEIC